MGGTIDFFGISFEAEYLLFADEFPALPGVYVIYTEGICLYIGHSDNLKTSLEEHPDTREWIKNSHGGDIYIAFYLDKDKESRAEKVVYLREKMKPLIK